MSELLDHPVEQILPPSSCDRSMTLPARNSRRAVGQGCLVIIDQGLYSVTSFATGVLLARICIEYQYGYFVMGLTLLTTLLIVQRCLVSVPYSVLWSAQQPAHRWTYLGSNILHECLISCACAAVLVVAGGITRYMGQGEVAAILLAMSLACPALLQRDWVRSTMLAHGHVKRSLALGIVTNGSILIGLLWLYRSNRLTVPAAFWLLALCAGIPALLLLMYASFRKASFTLARATADFATSWRFGRWTLGACILHALGAIGLPWLILIFHGAQVVAVWGVLLTVAGIVHPVILGVSAYLTPKLARMASRDGKARTVATGMMIVRLAGGGAAVYVILLALLGETILQFLYGGKYQGQGLLLAAMGVALGLEAVTVILRSLARAVGNPQSETWSSLWAVLACLSVGAALIPVFGLWFALVALIIYHGLSLALNYRMLTRSAAAEEVLAAGSEAP